MKKSTKTIIGIVAICVLLCSAILGVVAKVTDGFQDWEMREVNEDNLINVDNYVSTLDGYKQDGLKVTVNDDGVIAVTGENKAETDVEIEVCSVTLKADEYTLSCEAKGIDDKTYYLIARTGEGDTATTITVDSSKGETFKVESEATYTIYIVVCDGEEIDTTFKPVLVDDDEAGEFYVFSNK
ncbi:MAG: hypothetical protein J6A95_01805 [Clostridia bacterium]|nr:hypothetical protein [Clostridia bacterium]